MYVKVVNNNIIKEARSIIINWNKSTERLIISLIKCMGAKRQLLSNYECEV